LQRIRRREQEAIWQSTFSLNHFIGSIQHRLRNGQANLFRRLEINHQLDLHRLFGEEISGLGELATGFQRNAEQ
jgi:hypothetical protein